MARAKQDQARREQEDPGLLAKIEELIPYLEENKDKRKKLEDRQRNGEDSESKNNEAANNAVIAVCKCPKDKWGITPHYAICPLNVIKTTKGLLRHVIGRRRMFTARP